LNELIERLHFKRTGNPQYFQLKISREGGGSMVFRNDRILLHHYTVSQPRSPGLVN